MFENLSVRSMILMGAAVVATAGAIVSAVVDKRQAQNALEECCCECDCDVADPTAEI